MSSPTTSALAGVPFPSGLLAAGPGRLATNVMHFARVLRAAGMPVGTDRVQLALRALALAGLHSRTDFHAVLGACLIDRHAHQELFDQAFALFWRDPDLAGRMRAILLPRVQSTAPLLQRENRRLGEALFARAPDAAQPPAPEEIELEATLTASADEQLRRADFETLSADEYRAALRELARLRVVFPALPTRRRRESRRAGRLDLRATLRGAARQGGEFVAPPRYSRTRRLVPPLVVLADISGSMARYTRVLLHFAHLLASAHPHVESFVFGTRLTRLTPWLRGKDPDLAVARAVAGVQDWAGGTRIAECLHEFNRRWARRLLGGRATVLLVSDGLEHGEAADLGFEMERLAKSARRLLWLNPLLRYAGFEPRAAGMRAMLPHVSACLPVHNLQALAQLVQVLGDARPGVRGTVLPDEMHRLAARPCN